MTWPNILLSAAKSIAPFTRAPFSARMCCRPVKRPKTEISALLGISRQHLNDILREKKPISPSVAVRVGKLFGTGPGLWLRMQAAHDAWHAEREVDTSKIPTIKAA